MSLNRSAVAGFAAVLGVAALVNVRAGQQPAPPGQQPPTPSPLQLAPLGVSGEAIYPAFEGWGPQKDGQNVILIGYFNRNKEQELDIPIGPNNRIEPGGPDYGQPTHFETGRQYGVFAIPLPKDFGTKKLTWTLIANGQPAVVTFWMNPAYWVDFFKHAANGNEPPIIKIAENGPAMTGPPRGPAQTLTGTPWNPVELKIWTADQKATYEPERDDAAARGRGAPDDPNAAGRGGRGRGRGAGADTPTAIIGSTIITAGGRGGPGGGGGGGAAGRGGNGPQPDIRVSWHKHRGPGDVTYDDEEVRLFNKGDASLFLEAKTTAYFSEPGEYWIRAQVNDQSGNGGGGDQCCWTTELVKVTIK